MSILFNYFVAFERKKIQAETLSEYLREVRERLGLSVEDVSGKTGIKLKFLQALETGEFKPLPPDVYVTGFLRQLAGVYSASGDILVGQYKKEKAIANQMSQRASKPSGWARSFASRLVITPKLMGMAAGTLFVVATIGYIVWQVAAINKTPPLAIYEPVDRQVIKDSFVTIRGKTDPDISVVVNGQELFVDGSGNFKSQLSMEAGSKNLEIVASNKFGKTATREISVLGQAGMAALSSQVSLKLEFSADGSLTYNIDDAPSQSFGFRAGDVKILTGRKKIVIATTDAGATAVSLNDKRIGVLGRRGEALSNIPFFADSPPNRQ